MCFLPWPLRCFALATTVCLAAPYSAHPQAPAALSSTVLDPTAAPLPHATVHLVPRSRAASPAAEASTDAEGAFTLLATPGQPYLLTVQAPGFRDFSEPVTGGESVAPIHLTLAAATEQVDVEAEGTAGKLYPEETQTGVTLAQTQLTAVPLNGRGVTDLLATAPGVVPVSSAQPNAVVMSGVASTPPSGDLSVDALSVSGQRETANSFRVNGSDVQEDVNMGIAVVPTLDSVAQFEVLTDSFDAKLGGQSGGQIALTTRSGTAHLHGSAYDFLRNTALDARSYFSLTRAPFHQQQFGGTLGGPLPRTPLKFFVDLQTTAQTQGIDTGVLAVPSTANRSGDLSDLLAAVTGTVHGDGWAQSLAARLGYPVFVGEPYSAPGCTSTAYLSTQFTGGCVFPGGMIPQRAWSTPAQALLRYIPSPNLGNNTFSTSSELQHLHDDKGALRLDTGTRFGQANVYGFLDDYDLTRPYPTQQGGASVPGFSARNHGRAQLYAANLTTALGAHTVSSLHASYLRNAATVGQPLGGQGTSLAAQGFTTGAGTLGIVAQSPAIEGIESLVFNSFTLGTTVTGLAQAENLFEVAGDLTGTTGKHLFSLGAGFHADQINTHPDVYNNGSFLFTGSETGLDFADFLLGIDTSYTQGDGQNFYNRNHYLGLYAQDRWRATETLTLNYGLRWDMLPPWSEKFNQLLSLDPNEQSVVFPNAPKGILFPGDPGIARTIAPTHYMNFAPRLAASWAPSALRGKTVLRLGYGLYFSAFEGLSAGIMSGNPPYGFTDTTPAPTLFAEPFREAATGQSLGQRFPLQHVPFNASPSHPVTAVNWSNFEPLTGIPAFDKANVTPRTENYTLGIAQQITPHTTAALRYVGTQAHHLLAIQEVNPGEPALCLALSRPAQVAPGSPTCGPFDESSTFTAADGTMYIGTRTAFSGAFGSVNLQRTLANAHSNALEASFEHASETLFLQIAYTWSQSIDQSSSLAEAVPPGDAGRSRALSAFDLRHNASALFRYTLPWGRWAPTHPRLAQGWQMSGLTRFGTGLPVTLVNNSDTSLLGTAPNGINNNGIDEPAFKPGDLRLHHRPGAPAFNTALFTLPALGTLGDARRRFFAGPGLDNTDLALSKSTPLYEALTLELRAEAFNTFNHAQFFGPAAVQGNLAATNFGQIQTASSPRLMQLAARLQF